MKGNPARIDVDEGCSWWRFVDAGISRVHNKGESCHVDALSQL